MVYWGHCDEDVLKIIMAYLIGEMTEVSLTLRLKKHGAHSYEPHYVFKLILVHRPLSQNNESSFLLLLGLITEIMKRFSVAKISV